MKEDRHPPLSEIYPVRIWFPQHDQAELAKITEELRSIFANCCLISQSEGSKYQNGESSENPVACNCLLLDIDSRVTDQEYVRMVMYTQHLAKLSLHQ